MGGERKAGASRGVRQGTARAAEGGRNRTVAEVTDSVGRDGVGSAVVGRDDAGLGCGALADHAGAVRGGAASFSGGEAVETKAARQGAGRVRGGGSVSATSKKSGPKAGRGSGTARAAAKPASRPNKRQMMAFLDALAESSNITASARVAGLPANSFYRERRRNADFADQWHDALCEGFVRLEAELLAEALVQPSALVKDATLKARAQKYRLGLALLAAHRAAVRGTGRGASAGRRDGALGGASDAGGAGQARQRLAEKLRNVQARARVGGDAEGRGNGAGDGSDEDEAVRGNGAEHDGSLAQVKAVLGALDDGAGEGLPALVGPKDSNEAGLTGSGWDHAL